MGRIGIIGASRLGQLIAHHVAATGQHEVVGFFDNNKSLTPANPTAPILGGTDAVRGYVAAGEIDGVFIGVGYANFHWRRQFCLEFGDLLMPAFKHPQAMVDPSARLGRGSVILPGAIVDTEVVLNENVLVNVGAVLAHHTIVGAHSFVAPAAAVAGHVEIGQCCFLGLGCRIVNDIAIISGCCIGAGAVVTQGLTQPGVYVGVPARLVTSSL